MAKTRTYPVRSLDVAGGSVAFVPLEHPDIAGEALPRLPLVVRILVEMLCRRAANRAASDDLIAAASEGHRGRSLEVHPTRLVLQDHSGLPVLLDLVAVQAAVHAPPAELVKESGLRSAVPLDLVVDHSVEAHVTGSKQAFALNLEREYRLNKERYAFLRWAEQSIDGLRVHPPGNGIVHQVNLERLATVVTVTGGVAHPEIVLGTDSHTPMINGLGVLGWGIGGVEAAAVVLGEPSHIDIPKIVGVELRGRPAPGVLATDIVLTLTSTLRGHGVVGALLEFFGPGVSALTVGDRSTIANMAPEFGATCALFPVDGATLRYLRETGRDSQTLDLVMRYLQEQGLFGSDWRSGDRAYDETLVFDLSLVEPSVAGPQHPRQRRPLAELGKGFAAWLGTNGAGGSRGEGRVPDALPERGGPPQGAVAIAAITSCTNTANPALMITAGLLARNALARGLRTRPWVKASLAPGSPAVTRYLRSMSLLEGLEGLGFHVTGYGCMTCIGNSGPLDSRIAQAIAAGRRDFVAVISGNRNFPGRIHPDLAATYLMSPPLVVAFALSGHALTDVTVEPLGVGASGEPVYLRELWPDPHEVTALLHSSHINGAYKAANHRQDERAWADIDRRAKGFEWDPSSSYLRQPPFAFAGLGGLIPPAWNRARALVVAGDDCTTDHISPAGPIVPDSQAGDYLHAVGVPAGDFGTYGTRRGNHEVLVRGTFANPSFRNALCPEQPGAWTRHQPSGDLLPLIGAAERYSKEQVPLIIIAGTGYGMGSSRDWAAKGPWLLGVRGVLAESFERIHRRNLVCMGIIPFRFQAGQSARSLGIDGTERYSFEGIDAAGPRAAATISASADRDGRVVRFDVDCLIMHRKEAEYLRAGGILARAVHELRRRRWP